MKNILPISDHPSQITNKWFAIYVKSRHEKFVNTKLQEKGIDSGLIDLVLVGQVDDEKLKEVTAKTENLIDRKIRTLVLAPTDLEKLQSRLDIEHSLFIWGKESVMGEQ